MITERLLERFDNPVSGKSCEHVAQVLLTWVNNHYNDFETNARLYDFLELFDDRLQNHEDEVRRTNQRLEASPFSSSSSSSKFDRGDILSISRVLPKRVYERSLSLARRVMIICISIFSVEAIHWRTMASSFPKSIRTAKLMTLDFVEGIK